MLRVSSNLVRASNGVKGTKASNQSSTRLVCTTTTSICMVDNMNSSIAVHRQPQKIATQTRNIKASAGRRRRVYSRTETTYVLLEPGEEEKFVSEEELRAKLKGWLENWPTTLPPDLASFLTIDDAVSYLVKAVCELEINGEVGSIQWYQVRLE